MLSRTRWIAKRLILLGFAVTMVTIRVSGQSIVLPAPALPLNDLSAFTTTGTNWVIAGNAFAKLDEEQSLSATPGKGVLANLSDKTNRSHLFTKLEHGDIEIELDVMMAKGSNSGIYFQGRYELQLFDSWGKAGSKYSYMGGIYQRTDPATNKGYEGSAPLVNACRAPGLWQTLRVIFKAPTFDGDGKKISDARFVKVWLNGALVQDDVPVTGPTRSAAFNDERPTGPLMIQGNHGRVAFRNIRYKAFSTEKVSVSDLTYKQYKTTGESMTGLARLDKVAERKVDSISRHFTSQDDIFLMEYKGWLTLPRSGTYLFTVQTGGGGILVVNKDTVIRHDGANAFDEEAKALYNGRAGRVPFTLIYNKPIAYRHGLALYVEGPSIAKHALHAKGSPFIEPPVTPVIVEVPGEKAVVQRSFMSDGKGKRTHCVSVGTPKGIHFTIDTQDGTIFRAWDGGFLDATPMWHRRGNGQVALPLGAGIRFQSIPLVGQPADLRFSEYTLDRQGLPEFQYQVNDILIRDKIVPSDTGRSVTRTITSQGQGKIEFQIAVGRVIEKVGEGLLLVNDKEYYLFVKSGGPVEIRTSNNMSVVVVSGDRVEYTVLW